MSKLDTTTNQTKPIIKMNPDHRFKKTYGQLQKANNTIDMLTSEIAVKNDMLIELIDKINAGEIYSIESIESELVEILCISDEHEDRLP